MKIKFQNECTYTYSFYLQLKRKTMDKSFVNTCYGALIILLVIMVFLFIQGWFKYALLPIILIVFVLYRLVGTPIRLANYATSKNREIHGKDIETKVDFYEDHLLATNLLTKGKTNIKYVDVIILLETKDLIILEMEKGLVILVDKNGFTKGTYSDFVEFIKSECTNAEDKI